MPKVTHLSSVHKPDDVRIFLKECRTLAAAGYDVSFVVPAIESKTIDSVTVRAVPAARHGRFERAVLTTFRVFRAALNERSDVYHFHDFELITVALLLKAMGKRVIYDVHESVPDDVLLKEYLPSYVKKPVALLARALEAIAARVLDAVVPATPAIARRFPPSRRVLVQNFPIIDEMITPTPDERQPLIAYVGGIENIRGVREAVDAMALLSDTPGARLALAGRFDPPALEQEIRAHPAASRVDILGVLSRPLVANLLGRARAGLVTFHPLSSHIEAQPNKLFEYMSAGIPVIASDFPLWRQVVEEVGCGLLVDPLDRHAIAAAMRYLINHPDKAAQMGERGREAIMNRYNWPTEAAKLLALYARLTNHPTGARHADDRAEAA